MLSKVLPDLSWLYTFGCLCLVTLPTPLRSGDKHFMDRGAPGLYLGPSEEGQCHVVYVFALRRVLPVAKIRVWEDEFPGLRGDKYRWFPDDPSVVPGGPAVEHNMSTDEPSGFMRGPSQDQSATGSDSWLVGVTRCIISPGCVATRPTLAGFRKASNDTNSWKKKKKKVSLK